MVQICPEGLPKQQKPWSVLRRLPWICREMWIGTQIPPASPSSSIPQDRLLLPLRAVLWTLG